MDVSDCAVCTSGEYERGAHILDPRDAAAAPRAASATVIAPTAMLADALATAAFVLGPGDGIALLERMGVQGLLITPELEQFRYEELRSWVSSVHFLKTPKGLLTLLLVLLTAIAAPGEGAGGDSAQHGLGGAGGRQRGSHRPAACATAPGVSRRRRCLPR